MPIYVYRREDGTTFEVMQKFSDDPLETDPETGQKVQRVLFAPAVHFKGSGFYNTDYGTRRKKRELESSAESGANDHDDKMRAQRDEKKKAAETKPATSSSTDSPSKKPAA
jgi:putative FmdB family regulatory protein